MNHRTRHILVFLGIALSLCLPLWCNAEPNSTIYISDSKTSIGEDVFYIRGSAQDLRSEDIVELYRTGQFQKSKLSSPSLGLISDIVWVALPLQSINQQTNRYYLELAYSQLDSVKLYELQSNTLEHLYSTGDTYFFDQRPIIHRHFVFPIELSSDAPRTLFLRIETTGSMQFPLHLWTQKTFWNNDQGRLLLQAIYLGLILVMVAYNLFLYVSTREQVYLNYILSILSIAAMLLTLTGMGFQMLWPNSPEFNEFASPMFMTLATIFSARFTDDFLSLPIQLPWASKVLRLIAIGGVINFLMIPWVPYTWNLQQSGILCLLCLILNLTSGTLCFQKGDRSAGYYMLAWSTFLVGGVSVALNKFGWVAQAPATEYALQVGSALEVVLLSFALGYRMNVLEEQNHQANVQRTQLRKEMTSHLQSRLHIFSRITSELNKPLNEMHRLLRLLGENMVGASSVVDFLFPGSSGDDEAEKTELQRSVNERKVHLATLQDSFENVAQVVRELQGMGVIGGKLKEDIDIHALIANALDRARNEHGVRNYKRINLRIPESPVQSNTQGNPYIIGHAVSALVINAFTHALDASSPSVIISMGEAPESIGITIKNNGPAIPAETIATLFDHSRAVSGSQATSLPVLRTVLQQQNANIRLMDSGNQSGWVQFEIVLPKSHSKAVAAPGVTP